MCKDADESVDDLLISWGIDGYEIFSFPPLPLVIPYLVKDLLVGWCDSLVGKKKR